MCWLWLCFTGSITWQWVTGGCLMHCVSEEVLPDNEWQVVVWCIVFQRKYYLTMIDRWLSDAFDSLDSIAGIYYEVYIIFLSIFLSNCSELIDWSIAELIVGRVLCWWSVELPILEHMSKMTDKRSAEKQSTLDEKPTRDKPVYTTALT